MLHLILGRVGAGKTTHVHKLINDYIRIGYNDIILIVPEQFSFASERAMLSLLGAKDANRVNVLSFTRLSDSVFREYGGKRKKCVSDAGRTALMSIALESVRDKLEIYPKYVDRPAVISEMLSLSSEFKQGAVSCDLLWQTAESMEDSLLKKKIRDLSIILSAYEALLVQGNIDDGDALTELYFSLGEKKYFKNKVVVIDGFKGFTQQEFKIIERILVQSKVTYITLCMDEMYPLSDDGGIFAHVKKTARKLIDITKKHNIKLAKPLYLSGVSKFCNFPAKFKRYNCDALAALESGLYEPRVTVYEKNTDEIVLCSAENISAECSFIAAKIKSLMRQEGIRCRDIAVIARNAELYESPLKSALKKCDIPVFEDKRQPINVQPLIKCIMAALEISAHGFSSDSVFAYLKSGICEFEIGEISALENYVIMWQIDGGKWMSDWSMNPEGYGVEMTARTADSLFSINELRKKVIEPLIMLKNILSDANGLQASKAIYDFLVNINAASKLKELAIKLEDMGATALALEQERIWDCVITILDETAMILSKKKFSASRFYELFKLIIDTQTLGDIPKGIDEITIGSADRVRMSSPRVVFVVGVNDGVFPLNPVSKGIFNDFERREMIKQGLTVNEPFEFKVIEERFIAYTALCCASQRLFVSYARKDSAGAELAPSELVFLIKHQFPHCKTIDTECIDDIEKIEGVRPAFELACEKSREGGTLYRTLKKYFEQRSDYADKLVALKRATSAEDFKIQNKGIAEKLFGDNMYLSASRTERYYKCPFSYFCEYGLRAQPRKIAEFDPMQRGTVSHYVLETVLSKYTIEELIDFESEQRRKIIKEVLDAYLEEKLGGGDKPKRFEYLYNRLVKILDEVFSRLISEFSVSKFRPVDFELKIDNDGTIAPYSLNLGDNKTLKIKGSVDRVDKMELDGKSYIRVVDYKLSGKKFELCDVLAGLNMQMLVYLFAIWKNGKTRYGDVIPSGILYMPANAPVANINKRNPSEEEIQKEKLENSKMSGMVLDSSIVILGMENSGAGVFIPAGIKNDGSLSGKIISLEQLGKLKGRMDELLLNMAHSLQDGKIQAVPVTRKTSYKDTCKYCDFSAVCGREEGMPTRTIESINHDDCLKILSELEVRADEVD